MSIREGDRVYYRYDINCTGTVIGVMQLGYYYERYLYQIAWDFYDPRSSVDDDPEQWYRADWLVVIPSPPPAIQKDEEPRMSQALWCDMGGHAFSAKDPDRQHYTSTRQVTDGRMVNQVTAEMDICGKHAKEVVLYETPALSAGTVQDAVPTQDV